MVEHDLAKVGVASSSLVFRSFFLRLATGSCCRTRAQMAELVDACVSGAHAARCAGSSPVLGTKAFLWGAAPLKRRDAQVVKLVYTLL